MNLATGIFVLRLFNLKSFSPTKVFPFFRAEYSARKNGKTLVEERLDKIIIPRVELEEARLEEVIEWLRQAARKHDPRDRGVNLIVKLDDKAKDKKITLNLRQIPFDDLIRYVCIVADLNYRVTGKVVYIYSGELPGEEMKTRYYHIKNLPVKSD